MTEVKELTKEELELLEAQKKEDEFFQETTEEERP